MDYYDCFLVHCCHGRDDIVAVVPWVKVVPVAGIILDRYVAFA
jgi:hypothetical protein